MLYFEISLQKPVYDHIKGKLSGNQHGFMKVRSTVTNLITTTQFITEYSL